MPLFGWFTLIYSEYLEFLIQPTVLFFMSWHTGNNKKQLGFRGDSSQQDGQNRISTEKIPKVEYLESQVPYF